MYSVEFSEKAASSFNKLEKSVQKRVVNVLERIKIRPFYFMKKKEETPYYILRIGDYRAITRIDQNKKIIFIVEVGHRKNIYK